ncbi:Mur ligase family protein [Lysinibacter cavernae]|nr:Mur ligase family protein [Lysinibacter cavernae]
MRGGSGSALPGLLVEKIDPHFMRRTLDQLPFGVVVISGTNGKTTTTKMVVELLEGQGLTVFTNKTGSNFTRGVASALLGEVSLTGKTTADIAILELDEAHAVHFVRAVAPKYSLLLNVMRDQLDRFGEIDTTANLLREIAIHTTDAVVLNREDPRVFRLRDSLTSQRPVFFGLDESLLSLFPNDDSLRGSAPQPPVEGGTAAAGDAPATALARPEADVTLLSIDGDSAVFEFDGKRVGTSLQLEGVYNIYNAAAALALTRTILGDKAQRDQLITSLAKVAPAFGRGEKLSVNGQPLELVLVKNPSGFRLGLHSFSPEGYATMIAINDNYADGRDMSWLWDVEFDSLRPAGVATVTGIRAYDMALRLQYDEVAVGSVVPDLSEALAEFIAKAPNQPKRIFCTYTAMLALRRELGKITTVEAID